MRPSYPFGNDPAKIERYRAFWDRSPVARPLVGFSVKSWFPLQEFAASAAWQDTDLLAHEVHSGGPPIAGMIPAFRKIQAANRPLLVRGSFTPDELHLLVDSLDPRGLYLYIMVDSLEEADLLKPLVRM